MANQELVEILKRSIEVWNKWRSDHPKEVIDLPKVDLSGANLIRADLRKAQLIETDLSDAILRGNILSTPNGIRRAGE